MGTNRICHVFRAVNSRLEKVLKAGGALAAAVGQLRKALSPERDPPSPRHSSLCHCSAPPPSEPAQRELHSSPSSYKAGDPERDRLLGQNISSYTRKALGDLVPWVSSCPVPRQGVTTLSLPLHSSKAAQRADTTQFGGV